MTNFGPLAETLAGSWLALQCQMIPKVHRGAVYLDVTDGDAISPTACWPDGSESSPALNAATRLVVDRKCPVLCGEDNTPEFGSGGTFNIACPIMVEGRFAGVVAVEVDRASEQQQRAVMQLLQWGATWLEFLVRRETSSITNSLMTATRVVAICLEQQEFQAASTATATELATCLGCERVSIGLVAHGNTEVRAISHSANFKSKTNFVRDLSSVMDEALAQENVVVYPPRDAALVQITAEHAGFAQAHNVANICTVPLGDDGNLCGALMFERSKDKPFDDASLELCEVVASLLGPILELKRKDDRWIGASMRDEFVAVLGTIFGYGHVGLKLALVTLLALGTYMSIATGDYRVASKAVIEGTVQRVVVAPMEGFIATASARAGDLVRKGEVLGRLEDKELQLEQAQLTGNRTQLKTEYRRALAKRDRALTRVLSAQADQAQAQLNLIGEKLARTKLVAPFDGVVVSGDLSQQFGAPVERGQVLFEIAPLDSYRVVLEVDEREIGEIHEGQRGQLAMTALSGEVLDIYVEKITPVSNADDGRNYFRVEARLDSDSEGLRPGMQGVAKVQIGQRKLISIWTYKLVNWWRLWSWSWWP